MANENACRAAVTCVAVGLAALGLTACGSSAAKGGATALASAPDSSAVTSSTAAAATTRATSAVPAHTTPAAAANATSASAGPSDDAAKTAPSPCALVTAADVSAALRASVPAGMHQEAGRFDSCIYTSGSGSIVILVRSIDRATFDTSAKANPGGAVPVSGVGDDAYNASGTLLAWQAGTEIAIQLEGGSGHALTIEKRLAAAAVTRL